MRIIQPLWPYHPPIFFLGHQMKFLSGFFQCIRDVFALRSGCITPLQSCPSPPVSKFSLAHIPLLWWSLDSLRPKTRLDLIPTSPPCNNFTALLWSSSIHSTFSLIIEQSLSHLAVCVPIVHLFPFFSALDIAAQDDLYDLGLFPKKHTLECLSCPPYFFSLSPFPFS